MSATGPSGRLPSGSTATFDSTVINTGAAAATNVVVTFFAYAGLGITTIDCDASGGAACPFTTRQFGLGAQSYQSTSPSLPPQGRLHFRVTAVVPRLVSGPVQATITAAVNGQAVAADAQAQVVLAAYYDQIAVTGGALAPTAAPGGTATYVMALSNAGPDAAMNLLVMNDVGLQQTLVSATCVAGGGAVCPATPSTGATMTVPLLPTGGSLVFTMTTAVAANASGLLSDVFSAIDPGDRATDDNLRVATTLAATPSASISFLTLRSDPGEPLGGGAAYAYTQANAVIRASDTGDNQLLFNVVGDASWSGSFRLPATTPTLQPGSYSFAPGGSGSFNFGGNNGGCSSARTQLVIDSIAHSGATLSAIDLRFDQTCEGSAAALHGQLHWTAADSTRPPGAVNPPPAALWRAPAASTPSSGNYIYLASDAGDSIGAGKTTVLTQANAIFNVHSTLPGQLTLDVQADDDVHAAFSGVAAQSLLQRGYVGPIQTWPTNNPAIGSMSWSQGGRACGDVTGWFVIDDIRYTGTVITAVDARFEQHCAGAVAALRGQIHFGPGDTTVPPGPVQPPPTALWSPAAGVTPPSGNYAYLQSDAGDFLGGGGTYLLTPADTVFTATATGVDLKFSARLNTGSAQIFDGEFVGMNSIARLQPGYYPGLEGFPFNNPTKGGLGIGAFAHGCNVSSGWFVVDSVSYAGGALTSVDLRFEQHCENEAPALHGKIHWAAG